MTLQKIHNVLSDRTPGALRSRPQTVTERSGDTDAKHVPFFLVDGGTATLDRTGLTHPTASRRRDAGREARSS